MGRTVPSGIKEPFELLPSGCLLIEVSELKEEVFGDNNQLIYRMSGSVVAPEKVAGQAVNETFFIGTEEDPNAENAETWQKRAGRLKQCVEKAGVAFEGADMDVVCSEMQQRKVLAQVARSKEPAMKKGQPNPYAGRVRANVKGWLAEGEREPYVDENQLQSDPVGETAAPLAPTTPGMPGIGPRTPASPSPVAAAPAAPAPRPRVGR